ncbi:MAG TPA: iron ABC transporter permease [Spirochaetes bacterium]|nr:iron ABC transporter permease [Spirochaetota bacterium]
MSPIPRTSPDNIISNKFTINRKNNFNNSRWLNRRVVNLGDVVVFALPLLFLSIFFFYPMLSILAEGLTREDGGFTFGHIYNILSDPFTLRVILFTVEQALLSTLTSIALGLPGAYLLARYDFRGKSIIKAITTVPFVLPSIIVVLGFVIFFGNNGVLNRALMGVFNLDEPPLKILYSLKAIILAHTFYNFPICIRLVSAVWSRVNPNLEKAAMSLGAKGGRLFMRILLPQIMPGILAAAALIFIFSFTSFAVILVLGGGPKFSTIEVTIYRLTKVSLDLKAGSALAIVESVLSICFMYIYIKLQQKVSFASEIKHQYEMKKLSSLFGTPGGILALLYLIATFLIIIAPMLAAAGRSFVGRSDWTGGSSLTLEWYKRIFTGARAGSISIAYLAVIKNSLFFGFTTVLFSLPLGTIIAYITTRKNFKGRVVLETAAMLPIGISSIILGLGYIKAYQTLPIDITGRWYAIAFAHTVIAYPFVIRSVSAVFRKIDPGLIKAAVSLGATPWKAFWRVELPMIKSGIIAGATFAFAISIGEINATLMLYNPNLTTLPVAIYRLISSYNFFGACALSTILMLICFLIFLLIDKLGFEVT